MAQAWFNKLDFEIKADVENGRPPYLSSFVIRLNVRYKGKYEKIGIKVLPPRILVEYNDKDADSKELDYVYGESPIKYIGVPNFSSIEKALDHMDLPSYLKRVLKMITDNNFYDDPLNLLSAIESLGDIPDYLPRVTETLKIYGTIYDEIDHDDKLGKVYTDEYLIMNDEVEQEVSHNSFEVKHLTESDNGELIAVAQGRKSQLEVIIPTQREFEDLLQFVKDAVRP